MSIDFNVILKISECCPLACDYCYYFRNITSKHKARPTCIKQNTVNQLCKLIMDYNKTKRIDRVHIALHGGEPLVVGKIRFKEICESIKSILDIPHTLSVQTNGVLIDREWIQIFKDYDISVGISSDGPERYHDIHRKMKNGQGSFALVDKSIRQCLVEQVKCGILLVVDPDFPPNEIFNYLIQDLKITSMDLLLRDYTVDTIPSDQYVQKVKRYMKCMLQSWIKFDDSEVHIRVFDSMLNLLLGKKSRLEFGFSNSSNEIQTITVYTDGDISPADELISISNSFMNTNMNVWSHTLNEVFNLPIFHEICNASKACPTACSDCYLKHVCCGGGGLLERYSKKNKFNNKSVYCSVWKELFAEMIHLMLSCGYPKDRLLSVLLGGPNNEII